MSESQECIIKKYEEIQNIAYDWTANKIGDREAITKIVYDIVGRV